MKCLRCNKILINKLKTAKFCDNYCQEKYWRENNLQRVKKNYYRNHDKYAFGGMRDKVLERDNECCVKCKMIRSEHKQIFKVDITVDHIDGNRSNNFLSNLQTLCLKCHGLKDTVRGKKFYDLSIEKQLIILNNLNYGRSVRHKNATK